MGIAGGVHWATDSGPDAQAGREVYPATSRRDEAPSPGRTGSGGVYCAGQRGLDWEWLPERRIYAIRRTLPGDARGNSLSWVAEPAGVRTWITCDGLRVRAWAFTPAPPPPPAASAPVAVGAEVAVFVTAYYCEQVAGWPLGDG